MSEHLENDPQTLRWWCQQLLDIIENYDISHDACEEEIALLNDIRAAVDPASDVQPLDNASEGRREASAALIAEIASQHPWAGNAGARMALKIAERAVLRGRLLTEAEKISNMADFLAPPASKHGDEE